MSSTTLEQLQQQLNNLQEQLNGLKQAEPNDAPDIETSVSEEDMMAAMMNEAEQQPLEQEAETPEPTQNAEESTYGGFDAQAAIDYTSEKHGGNNTQYSEQTIAFFKHEDTLQRIMHVVKDGILLIDQHGVIRGFSKGAEDIFGYKEEDVIDTRAQKLFPQDEREKFKKFFFRLNEEATSALESQSELPQATTELDAKHFLHADMRRVKLDMHAIPFDDAYFYICLAQDMRQVLKHKERMLERSQLAQLLKEVARSLNHAPSIEDAICKTLELLGEQIHFDLGHAYIYCAQENTFKSHNHWVKPKGGEFALFKNTTAQTTFNETEGLIGVTFQYAEPQHFEYLDETLNDARLTAMKSTGFKQAITLPVLVKDIPVAVIELYLREEIEVDEHMIDILHNIGYQVGHTLRRLEAEHRMNGTEDEAHLDHMIATTCNNADKSEQSSAENMPAEAFDMDTTEETSLDSGVEDMMAEAAFEDTAEGSTENNTTTEITEPSSETPAEPMLNMGVADLMDESPEEESPLTIPEPESLEEAPAEQVIASDMDITEDTAPNMVDEPVPNLDDISFEEPEDTTLADISFDDAPVEAMPEPEKVVEEEEVQDLSPLQKLALEAEESKYEYTSEGAAVKKEESALDMSLPTLEEDASATEQTAETNTMAETTEAESALSALESVAQEQTDTASSTETPTDEDSDDFVSEEDRRIAEQMMAMES